MSNPKRRKVQTRRILRPQKPQTQPHPNSLQHFFSASWNLSSEQRCWRRRGATSLALPSFNTRNHLTRCVTLLIARCRMELFNLTIRVRIFGRIAARIALHLTSAGRLCRAFRVNNVTTCSAHLVPLRGKRSAQPTQKRARWPLPPEISLRRPTSSVALRHSADSATGTLCRWGSWATGWQADCAVPTSWETTPGVVPWWLVIRYQKDEQEIN